MSKKLTSVEWLEDMIKNMVYNGADFGDDYPSLLVHIERAKEIEKEQKIHAYAQCYTPFSFNRIGELRDDFELYYNKTYGEQISDAIRKQQDNDKD